MQFQKIVFSQHALTRMFERSISPELVRRAIKNGAIIANYQMTSPIPVYYYYFLNMDKRSISLRVSINRSQPATLLLPIHLTQVYGRRISKVANKYGGKYEMCNLQKR